MYSRQISLIFSNLGLDDLYEKYQVPLDIHGILDDPDTGQRMEQFLSIYDFSSSDISLFDEFLAQYKLFKRVITQNPDLPIDYMDWNTSSNEFLSK